TRRFEVVYTPDEGPRAEGDATAYRCQCRAPSRNEASDQDARGAVIRVAGIPGDVEGRVDGSTLGLGQRASGMERAPGRQVDRVGGLALQDLAASAGPRV